MKAHGTKKVLVPLGLVVLLIAGVIGYRLLTPKVKKPEVGPLVAVSAKSMPRFADDAEGKGLAEAIQLHIDRLQQGKTTPAVRFGEMTVTRERVLKTLELFSSLLEKKGIRSLAKEIPRHFQVFQASGQTRVGDVLFTGYYQPVLDAQSYPGGEYRYPLYRKPDDLQVIDLERINPKLVGAKIALRVEQGVIKPYFDRKAIDEDLVLKGRGLELAYLRDFLDRYMLQVQGSGILNLEDGGTKNVHFVASNCYPYVSLGQLLKDDAKISSEGMSLEAIRRYYEKNPKEIEEYLYRNQRYIFFEEFTGPVVGSEGVALTPGRSIATDKTLFPGGGLAFIRCLPSESGRAGNSDKHALYRFMVDQDTGSAMQGPGRVDIFWGTGKEAEKIAGNFKKKGKLYYLLIKE